MLLPKKFQIKHKKNFKSCKNSETKIHRKDLNQILKIIAKRNEMKSIFNIYNSILFFFKIIQLIIQNKYLNNSFGIYFY